MNEQFSYPSREADESVIIRPFRSSRRAANDEPRAGPAESGRTIHIVDPTTLQGASIPKRCFHVPEMIPHRTVTIQNGDGGTGKSLLALQLCASTALGRLWLGRVVEPGRALFISAEDDLDEVHRRLSDICADVGVSLAELADLRIASLAGEDAVLAAPNGKSNIIRSTALWTALETYCEEFRPRLLVLDTLADLFAGEENNRAQARQFIGLLRGLALRLDMTVLLLAHPSLSGMSSGSGSSGSTAWSNSVRSRLYLRRVLSKDGEELDPDLRILETKKANYAARGTEITLRWKAGVFVPEGGSATSFDQLAAAARAESVFMDMLRTFEMEGRHVSPINGRNYAPAVFAEHPDAKGTSKRMLEAAMNRLLKSKSINIEKHGPPSRERTHLVTASTGGRHDD